MTLAVARSLAPFRALLRALDRAAEAGARPVAAWSGAAFRIAFGLLGAAAVVRFAARGWIEEFYAAPEHHFAYSGFWWVRPWPEWGMHAHFALLGLAAVGVALGYRYRLSVTAFFLLFTYVELLDKTLYLNHYYLVSLLSFLMIFMPLHRAWSLDARRNPPPEGATVPAWTLWALRAQVGAVYLFAGAAKLNPDWLLNAQPLRIWLSNSADAPLIGALLGEAWAAYSMSWTGAAFDLTIVGWLLWRRSRLWAYGVLAAFHIVTWLLFPIGMFPWVMMSAALIFFPADWPLRLRSALGRPAGAAAPRPSPAATRRPLPEGEGGIGDPGRMDPCLRGQGGESRGESGRMDPRLRGQGGDDGRWRARAAVGALALFALAQALVPLRHWAYPGNVRWNEDGYRFSWRVLLTEKHGHARFRVRDPATGSERVVLPEEYLTPLQAERMATQPDMILAAAHIIARDYERKGVAGAEVRADAFVAFNGREAARFIDPEVDLARVRPGLWPKRFVLPGPPGRRR